MTTAAIPRGFKITDRNGNMIFIDSKEKNITITALETMTLNAKTMKINVDEDMEVKVQQNMKVNVTQKIDMQAMDVSIDASDSFDAKGEASAKVEGAQVEINGTASAKVSGAMLDLEGSATATLKAAIVQIN
ncbi:MAG TPA: hypothetical protein VFE53_10900 [Mucilaginibacter sp.]|nr:hypothetical protein [Mucilaginibacter sp.]